jgi:hypothetical protein
MEALTKRVFLSYSHDERAIADEIRSGLERSGIEVWSDQVILPGQEIVQRVDAALRGSDAVVFLFGRKQSPWTSLETAMATAQGKRIIPLIGDRDSEVPLLLQGRRYLDVSDPGRRETQIEELASVLQRPEASVSVSETISTLETVRAEQGLERAKYEQNRAKRQARFRMVELSVALLSIVAAVTSFITAAFAGGAVTTSLSTGLLVLFVGSFLLRQWLRGGSP